MRNPTIAISELQHREILRILRGQSEPLFVLLDAAVGNGVLDLLRRSGVQHQSLYEGAKGDELADVAPYLVHFSICSPFLDELVNEAWGKSWGVFLTSVQSFAEIRRHFRHFLLVQTEDGKQLYFRFYDPRVMRQFLPTCTREERVEFFGGISKFLMESQGNESLLEFSSNDSPRRYDFLPRPEPTSSRFVCEGDAELGN